MLTLKHREPRARLQWCQLCNQILGQRVLLHWHSDEPIHGARADAVGYCVQLRQIRRGTNRRRLLCLCFPQRHLHRPAVQLERHLGRQRSKLRHLALGQRVLLYRHLGSGSGHYDQGSNHFVVNDDNKTRRCDCPGAYAVRHIGKVRQVCRRRQRGYLWRVCGPQRHHDGEPLCVECGTGGQW
jgi:hypothetical protein